jgi:hypothetical protein
MHERIDVVLDKHDIGWHEPEEKDIFLNFALNEYVKNKHAEFEVNEKRREDIRTLVLVSTGAGVNVALPSDFLFALSLKGVFQVVDCGVPVNKERFIRPIQHDDINKIADDPFNKPTNDHPVYISTSIDYTIKSDNAPTSWTLTYLKVPVAIDGTNNPTVSSDLPSHTHEEIVNLAVRKIMASIEKETYSLQVNEIQNQE